MKEFQDIKIIDVAKNKTIKVSTEKELYYVYLELSKTPTTEWAKIFDNERKFPRHTLWRKAYIEGKYIVIICALEEIKQFHLNDLKENVKNSNEKYRSFLKEKAIGQKKQEETIENEKKKIDDSLDKLDFS
jgi:hypothetical protein